MLLICTLTFLQPVKDLPVPAVVTDTVVVRHSDQRCYPTNSPQLLLPALPAAAAAADAGAAGDSTAAAVWSQLEQLVAVGEATSTNWLEGAKQVSDAAGCCWTLIYYILVKPGCGRYTECLIFHAICSAVVP